MKKNRQVYLNKIIIDNKELKLPEISKIGKIRLLRKKGLTFEEIGTYFGLSRQRIHQMTK